MRKELIIGTVAAAVVFLFMQGIDMTPVLLLGGLFFAIRYMMEHRGQDKRFSVTTTASASSSQSTVTFADIGGQEVAKREFLEALDFLKESETADQLGIRPLRGVLLVGPPGTGKTLLAKAAASRVDAAFISASGSEFIEMYAGVGARRIRQLFEKAKQTAERAGQKYAIIFIDEIEVLGGKRGRQHSHLEYDQTLNELLVQMDGMPTTKDDVRLLVLGATNREDLLDPALTRPGRFDRTVRVDLPDKAGRLHILKIHANHRPLHPDVDLEDVARETFGFSGAHLESLLNEAGILALRDKSDVIKPSHIKEAIDKVMMGEKLDRRPSDEERKRIAYHEIGHALLSETVRPHSVATVTITSRGGALGYMRQTPDRDPYLFTRQDLLDQIAIALAGAVAEDVFFDSRSTGSMNDFEQAVKLAERIVHAGLSDLGIVSVETLSSQAKHDQVQRILRDQEQFVRQQIEQSRARIQEAALHLLEHERLEGDAFRAIISQSANKTQKGTTVSA